MQAYRYERGLALMAYKFVDKKYISFANKSAKDSDIKSMPNQQLQNEFHKLIIRNYKIRRVYFSSRDNIWGAHLTDMELISKYSKGIRYLLCDIVLFGKHACVVPLKDKKGFNIFYAFQSVLGDSMELHWKRKPKK